MKRLNIVDSRHIAPIALFFSFGLSTNTIVVPLLAFASGYTTQTIGILVAGGAGAQILLRMLLSRVMHRFAEVYLIAVSALLLCASTGSMLLSKALAAFVIAQVLQGAARGFFWIGLQSQVVRSVEAPLTALAVVDFITGIGTVLGAGAIGVLGSSLSLTLWLGLVASGMTVLAVGGMRRLPAAYRVGAVRKFKIRGHPGLAPAIAAATSTGMWRGLLGSYIPLLLVASGHPNSVAGLVTGLCTGASVFGSIALGLLQGRALTTMFVIAAVTCGGGLALAAVLAHTLVACAALLILSGVGAGMLQTSSPTLAAHVVPAQERGRAVAEVGTYRAAALLCAPLAVAGLLGLLSLTGAMVTVGAAVAGPAVLSPRRRPRRVSSEGDIHVPVSDAY